MILTNRRELLIGSGLLGLAGLTGCGGGTGGGGRGTLVIGFAPEPTTLTSAATTAGPTQAISTKIFDGLVTFDGALQPRPQLATAWATAPDNLSLTLKLRPGVLWHDGKPFTSADVAFSLMKVWREYHARGRATFANVTAVDTPDPLTAVIRLSRPAPYLLSALGSAESQVIPAHVYANGDILGHPANLAPIGTGPFRFAEWSRGQYISLVRNERYWDQPRPNLDGIVYRIIPDASAAAAAFENGEVHLLTSTQVPLSDVARLGALPGSQVYRRASGFTSSLAAFEFNLDRPQFRDPRVRRAFAHAIDRRFILDKIWYGYGSVANSPIPADMGAFHTDAGLPDYAFDPRIAAGLLDAAGLRPGPDGVRLRITHDAAPTGEMLGKTAGYIRDSLARVGIEMKLRSSDFAGFLKRVYTDRDFDTVQYQASAGPDPAIGTQRFYWSRNFERGVAFSNGSHYASPEADRLLEAAQVETDPAARKALYADFQQTVQRDLPRIPLISGALVTIANARVRGFPETAYSQLENFSGVSLAS